MRYSHLQLTLNASTSSYISYGEKFLWDKLLVVSWIYLKLQKLTTMKATPFTCNRYGEGTYWSYWLLFSTVLANAEAKNVLEELVCQAVARFQGKILQFYYTNVVSMYITSMQTLFAIMLHWNNNSRVVWVWLSIHLCQWPICENGPWKCLTI